MKKTTYLVLVYLTSFTSYLSAQTGWAWMTGYNGPNGAAVYGTQGVADSANTPAALYEPAEWTDQQGNFWLFGGMLTSLDPTSTFWKFNPLTIQWTWIG